MRVHAQDRTSGGVLWLCWYFGLEWLPLRMTCVLLCAPCAVVLCRRRAPVRLGSVQASVLGCLTSLAEGPAARLLLDCDKLISSSASLAAGRAEEQQLQQLQVKMARKVRETHAALAVSGAGGLVAAAECEHTCIGYGAARTAWLEG